jgi:hypothetical protein
LSDADKPVVASRREEPGEEVADRVGHRQGGEGFADDLHEARRQEREREQDAKDQREHA